MPNSQYWAVYKLFYDPPGTPKDLRCINCKLASTAGLIGLAGLSSIGIKKYFMSNVFTGMTFGFITLGCLGAAAISGRMAYDDHKWNQTLISRKQKQ